MILTAREDANAPIDALFLALTDLPSFERIALRRGAKLTRTRGNGAEIAAGDTWELKVKFRGKMRDIKITAEGVERPSQIELSVKLSGIDAQTRIELLQISKGATRLSARTKLQPTSLSGRLLVQSLKLTRGSVERKYQKRVGQFAQFLSERTGTARA